jgi:hypothetical protein
VNIHFRLDDRNEARGDDLPSGFELLVHDVLDARWVGFDLKWPLPIRDGGLIDAELVGVLLTRDALVDQGFVHAGAGDTETGYPVNGIDG